MALCCTNCFQDFIIDAFIEKNGTALAKCDYCGGKRFKAVEASLLEDFLLRFVDIYEPKKKPVKSPVVLFYRRLELDWNLFNTSKANELVLDILTGPLSSKSVEPDFFNTHVESAIGDLSGTELTQNWKEFTKELRFQNRFFPQSPFELSVLESLFVFIECAFDKDSIFYRSRVSEEKLSPANMGRPPEDKAKSGRANPIGIPYLYLASKDKTALFEVRPAIKDLVTIGNFVSNDLIMCVDLRDVSPFQFIKDENFEDIIGKLGYLRALGQDLSLPLHPKETELGYLPTQYLCEFIKSKGWDGVVYNSAMCKEGYNVVLFDDTKVSCVSTTHYIVTGSSHDYEPA